MRNVHGGLAAVILSLACLGLGAAPGLRAEEKAAGASEAPKATAPTDARPLTKSFAAGGILGEVLAAPEDKALSAGGTAFAQVRLSADAGGRKGVTATLLIEAGDGEIAAITGSGIKVREEGKARMVTVDGLRKGRDRLVLF